MAKRSCLICSWLALNSSPLATKLRKDSTYINPHLQLRKEGRIQHSNNPSTNSRIQMTKGGIYKLFKSAMDSFSSPSLSKSWSNSLLGGRSLGEETRSWCFIVHCLNNCFNSCFNSRVDWPIIDLLHMIKHLFISSSYIFIICTSF